MQYADVNVRVASVATVEAAVIAAITVACLCRRIVVLAVRYPSCSGVGDVREGQARVRQAIWQGEKRAEPMISAAEAHMPTIRDRDNIGIAIAGAGDVAVAGAEQC